MKQKEKDFPPVEVIKMTRRAPSTETRHQDEEHVCQLLKTLVQELVTYPEDIQTRVVRGERTTIYHIDCTQRVIGQIIGMGGKTVQSLRTVIQAITAKKGFRSIIEIPYFEPTE